MEQIDPSPSSPESNETILSPEGGRAEPGAVMCAICGEGICSTAQLILLDGVPRHVGC